MYFCRQINIYKIRFSETQFYHTIIQIKYLPQMNRSYHKTKSLKKRAARLSFLIYLYLTIISLFLIGNKSTYAQSGCSIKLAASTVPARCQYDGEIHCSLSDTSGSQLEQIRFSYIPLSGIDSIIETSDPIVRQFRPGIYRVTVDALCRTGLGQADAYVIVSDTVEVTVGSDYHIPECGMLHNIFTFQEPYGIVPSLKCYPSGQVQISIQHGNFPYTIDIWSCEPGDTTFLRTVTFDTLQHFGNNASRFDYRQYFTIGSLPAGNYKFLCHDGCGYYTPFLFATVPTVKHDLSKEHHLLRNSSGDPTSYNVITFKEVYNIQHWEDHNDEYYYFMQDSVPMFEYRFVNPTLGDEHDTTQWYDLPLQRNNMAFLYDTVANLSNYGEIWFKSIQLQFRAKICEDTIWSYNFTIYPQGDNSFATRISPKSISTEETYYDFCKYHLGEQTSAYMFTGAVLSHKCTSCTTTPDSTVCANARNYSYSGDITSISNGMLKHSYITYPIHFKIIDLTRDSVILIATDSSLNYCWTFNCLTDTTLFGDSIVFEIMDDNGCPLLSDCKYFFYPTRYEHHDAINTYYNWEIVEPQGMCSSNMHTIGLMMNHAPTHSKTPEHKYIYSGDTLFLIESPRDNFYNLKAYIDRAEHYHTEKYNNANQAELLFKSYKKSIYDTFAGMIMQDYGLPSGKYTWVIHHACELPNDTIEQWVTFPEEPVLAEEPSYLFTKHCSSLEIKPIAGQFQLEGTDIETFFLIHQEDTIIHSVNSKKKGESLFIGLPGTYTLSMYALPKDDEGLITQNPCYIKDTIIQWDGSTIQADYLYSHVCNSEDSIGFVRARGKNGLLPYTYTIYSSINGEGNIMAQNTVGDFDNLPIHYGQALSIEMSDACGAHFLTNFTVSDMSRIRKGWAENDLSEVSICEGATCHFYGISLGGVTYHWTGPNGFERDDQNPELLIPRGSETAGLYHVELLGTGCTPLSDSILLDVIEAPSVHLAQDTSVCPGTEMTLLSTAYGSGLITYTIIRADSAAVPICVLSNRSSGITDSTHSLITHAPTVFYVTEIRDERCSFLIPEDTVRVSLISAEERAELICTNDTICKGEASVLTAKSTSVAPYVLRWQTGSEVLRRDTIFDEDDVSRYYFETLSRDTLLYVVAESAFRCPYQPEGIEQGTLLQTAGVIVYESRRVDTTIRQAVHEEELPYWWNGEPYYEPDSTTLTFARAHGCDSTVTFILRIIPEAPCPDAIDYDGNIYHAVRIDHLCWTQSNLRSEHYSDGRPIYNVMSYYSELFPNIAENVDIFGNLYTYEATTDTGRVGQFTHQGHLQGICPSGWYLPEESQYQRLGLHDIAELRSPSYWITGAGNNSTGFCALPAGFYNGLNNRYENLLGETRFWYNSATVFPVFSPTFIINRHCDYQIKSISDTGNGYSIRCILEE